MSDGPVDYARERDDARNHADRHGVPEQEDPPQPSEYADPVDTPPTRRTRSYGHEDPWSDHLAPLHWPAEHMADSLANLQAQFRAYRERTGR